MQSWSAATFLKHFHQPVIWEYNYVEKAYSIHAILTAENKPYGSDFPQTFLPDDAVRRSDQRFLAFKAPLLQMQNIQDAPLCLHPHRNEISFKNVI